MALKSDKEKKGSKTSVPEAPKQASGKGSSKAKKEADEDEEDESFDTPSKAAPKKTAKSSSKTKKEDDDDDDIDDDVEEKDDWEKVEEDEEWDPDFDEFDVPKSKVKKSTGGGPHKKNAKGTEEDDLGLDEDFKDLDLFGEGGFEEEEDDF
jgi:DNA-directed RNA polymerase subunit delta